MTKAPAFVHHNVAFLLQDTLTEVERILVGRGGRDTVLGMPAPRFPLAPSAAQQLCLTWEPAVVLHALLVTARSWSGGILLSSRHASGSTSNGPTGPRQESESTQRRQAVSLARASVASGPSWTAGLVGLPTGAPPSRQSRL